jgi:hypothetical protein
MLARAIGCMVRLSFYNIRLASRGCPEYILPELTMAEEGEHVDLFGCLGYLSLDDIRLAFPTSKYLYYN